MGRACRENGIGNLEERRLSKNTDGIRPFDLRSFLWYELSARDDGAVPIANSENLLEALQKNKVPAKLVTYDEGGHGFGMRKKGIPVENWPQEMKAWLTERKLISK